jgi:hypothetical protein
MASNDILTAGELRKVLKGAPDDLPVRVGIWGLKHFNEVLGTMPVTGVRFSAEAVLLHVRSLS